MQPQFQLQQTPQLCPASVVESPTEGSLDGLFSGNFSVEKYRNSAVHVSEVRNPGGPKEKRKALRTALPMPQNMNWPAGVTAYGLLRAIVNEKPIAWPEEVLRMSPAYFRIAAGKVHRARMLQVFIETVLS